MRYLSLLFLLPLFIACGNSTPEDLPKRIDQLIADDNYSQAIDLLDNASAEDTDANLSRLKEKTHLNYGLFLEYRGPDDSSMRSRMTSALEQYVAVLNINPKNQKARSEVKQIMDIYSTMPNKSPGEKIIAELNELGFDY